MRNFLIGCLLSVFVLQPVKAAQGDLDTTFGLSGFAFVIPETIGAFSDGSVFLSGIGVAIQSDGKVVVAGLVDGGAAEFAKEFVLARFNVNGTLDTTFGSGGAVTTTFDLISIPKTVAIQSTARSWWQESRLCPTRV